MDYEIHVKEEEKIETFKQSLIQAFPHLYDEIYENKTSFPESIEQRTPDDEEMFEIDALMDFVNSKQSINAEQIIDEEI